MAKRDDRSVEKESFWKLALDEWRLAGTSVREFCRSNGLKESAFYFWRRELAKRSGVVVPESRLGRFRRTRASPSPAPAASPTAMFLPLTIHPQQASGCGQDDRIEIVVGGHCVRVTAGFDEETLSRLMEMLELRAGRVPISQA